MLLCKLIAELRTGVASGQSQWSREISWESGCQITFPRTPCQVFSKLNINKQAHNPYGKELSRSEVANIPIAQLGLGKYLTNFPIGTFSEHQAQYMFLYNYHADHFPVLDSISA